MGLGDERGAWFRGVGHQGAAFSVEGVDGDADGGDVPRAMPTISSEIYCPYVMIKVYQDFS